MLIVCYAYEGMYQGLYGINTMAVLEISGSLEDAVKKLNEWGNIESEELIYSFGLEEEYLAEFDEDDEYADIAESTSYCDRGWYGYKVREGCFESATAADKKLCSLGMDEFVRLYCEKESL